MAKGIIMDIMRLQVFLGTHPAKHGRLLPQGTRADWEDPLAWKLSSLMYHLGLFVATLPSAAAGDPEEPPMAAGNPFTDPTDLSLLPLTHHDLFRNNFSSCLRGDPKLCHASIAFVAIHSHLPLSTPQLSTEEKSLQWLHKIVQIFVGHFRAWVGQIHASRVSHSSKEAAIKAVRKIESRKWRDNINNPEAAEMGKIAPQQHQRASLGRPPSIKMTKGEEGHSFSYVSRLCEAFATWDEIPIGQVVIAPTEVLAKAIEADFVTFMTNLMQKVDVHNPSTLPSEILSAMEDYIWCLMSIDHHLPRMDGPAFASNLMSLLHFAGQGEGGLSMVAEKYLSGIYENVLQPIVYRNMLVFSETFGTFVLPHCLIGDGSKMDGEKTLSASAAMAAALELFISPVEIDSVATLFGPCGTNLLVEDLLYRKAILPEMARLNEALEDLSSLNVNNILAHGIRLGCLLALRNLFVSRLASATRNKMPFIEPSIGQILREYSAEDPDSCGFDNIAGFMGIARDDSLVSVIRESGLFRRCHVSRLVHGLAHVIPHASRFISSLYVSEVTTASNDIIVVDGHFNNLNCLALSVSHLITSLSRATATNIENGEDPLSEEECIEEFLTVLARRMLLMHHQAQTIVGGKKKSAASAASSTEVHLYDSTVLLLSLIADRTGLGHGFLSSVIPLSLPLIVHKARHFSATEAANGKKLRSLNMDTKAQLHYGNGSGNNRNKGGQLVIRCDEEAFKTTTTLMTTQLMDGTDDGGIFDVESSGGGGGGASARDEIEIKDDDEDRDEEYGVALEEEEARDGEREAAATRHVEEDIYDTLDD